MMQDAKLWVLVDTLDCLGPPADSAAARRMIKTFERDSRADGMPSNILSKRKKELVDQLNAFIVMSKGYKKGKGDASQLAPPPGATGTELDCEHCLGCLQLLPALVACSCFQPWLFAAASSLDPAPVPLPLLGGSLLDSAADGDGAQEESRDGRPA